MPEPSITLGPTGASVSGSLEPLAEEFARSHMVSLPGFLDDRFCALLQAAETSSGFVRDTVEGLGNREVEMPLRRTSALLLALRGKTVLEWARTVTRDPDICDVGGNLVRTWPDPQDKLDWHDDGLTQTRVAALTIRLGTEPYDGGAFEFRAKKFPHDVSSHMHLRPGDALLFTVNPAFEHRVVPLQSGGPRTMFTGWFLRGAEA